MGQHYRHIDNEQRIKVYELLFAGMPIAEIAKQLGYHRATIYRELERNSCKQGYRPDWAAQQAFFRKRRCPKLDQDPELKTLIIQYLSQGWSPEQIAGRLKTQVGYCVISHETIYAYIYSPTGKAQKLYRYLMKKRRFRYPRIKRRRKKAKKSAKPRIDERDEAINQRHTFGHWEGDLMVFSKQRTNLITLRERKSRFIIATKNENRKAHSTTHTLIQYMKQKLKMPVQSLTLDNDPTFAHYKTIAASLNTSIYFCEPYKSYQKGAVENANKLLRQHLPRKIDMAFVDQIHIDNIVNKINNRPMKCLNFKTPEEVFSTYLSEL